MAENKKELIAVPIGTTPSWKLKWTNGGELPKELSGKYTSQYKAEQSAQLYLIKRNAKTKRNKRA